MDATRASDGMLVALKRVCMYRSSGEVDLAHYLLTLDGKSLRNHCVPILDILPVPGDPKDAILVMPLLKAFDEPPFTTFGEVVAFLSQIFEVRICVLALRLAIFVLNWYTIQGLEFMHDTVSITHG